MSEGFGAEPDGLEAIAVGATRASSWGIGDERGSLNHIDSTTIRAAAAECQIGLTVSCSAVIDKELELTRGTGFRHEMLKAGDGVKVDGPGFTEYLGLVFHGLGITHLDALGHTHYQDMLYNRRPRQLVTRNQGATALDVTGMRDGVVTRGVLLDVARARQRDHFLPGEPVLIADLEQAEREAKVTVQTGDALLLRTGWGPLQRAARGQLRRERPGLHGSTLPWLRERGVALVASDTANDVVPSGLAGLEQPLHQLGQAVLGMPLVDACDFEALSTICAKHGRWTCMFVIAPLVVRFATGSPVNPIAIL